MINILKLNHTVKEQLMEQIKKGDTFELDENVSDLYLRDDEAHGPSSHKRRFHFG